MLHSGAILPIGCSDAARDNHLQAWRAGEVNLSVDRSNHHFRMEIQQVFIHIIHSKGDDEFSFGTAHVLFSSENMTEDIMVSAGYEQTVSGEL